VRVLSKETPLKEVEKHYAIIFVIISTSKNHFEIVKRKTKRNSRKREKRKGQEKIKGNLIK